MNTNMCPVGCGRLAPIGKLLCRPCWANVPQDLRNRVYRSWRSWQNTPTSTGKARNYTAARDAAITAVQQHALAAAP